MHRFTPLPALALALRFALPFGVFGTAACAQTHAGALASGDERLSSGEYVDSYTVRAEPGQTLSADLTSAEFDTYLIVRGPSGAQEDNDDYEGSTGRSHLDVVAAERGTYAVSVTSYRLGETGRYRLDITVGGRGSTAAAGRTGGAGPAASGRGGAVAGHWVGAATGATQYQDRSTGAHAPTNGVGTTLDLAADGTYRQSRVMQQTTSGCTSTVNVDERGTYSAEGGQLVLNRQSGRSWGQICGGERYDRALGAETAVFAYEVSDGGARLTRHQDGEYFDTLSRQ